MTPPPETRDEGAARGVVVDFGRGSREQTQGGPARNKGNVHPILGDR